MIPILYSSNELHFSSNGIGRLNDCISCVVTEERNGIYECEFQYPITGRFYQLMVAEGGIIGVYHDDHHDIQPFDIYAFSAPIDGVVTFYAHHISYRLGRIILKPFTATSVAEVMAKIPGNSFNNNPFTFWTDKQTAASFKLEVPDAIRNVLGGQQGSILDVFGGGDYQFDLFSVKLYDDRGVDNGVTIRHGKNLSDITYDKDDQGTYNAIAPYWKDGNGNAVYLPEIYVTSANATGNKLAPWTTENGSEMTDENLNVIEFNYILDSPVAMDFSGYFQEQPTVDQLRQRAIQYLNSNRPWIPNENVKVDFWQLWQTPEYEDIAALQRVGLCDYVSVYYPELGVVKEKQKVIRTDYNVLLERFDSMEIGKPTTSLAQQILGTAETQTEQMLTDFEGVMNAAIEKATDLITGGLGGYVVFTLNGEGQPQEILIMDTPSVDTAVNVIRLNRNGIGFSTSGYHGTYRSAWTIDGAFNADFITAGTLNANLIKAGTLSDYQGRNYWNMLTGDMSITGDVTISQDDYTVFVGNTKAYVRQQTSWNYVSLVCFKIQAYKTYSNKQYYFEEAHTINGYGVHNSVITNHERHNRLVVIKALDDTAQIQNRYPDNWLEESFEIEYGHVAYRLTGFGDYYGTSSEIEDESLGIDLLPGATPRYMNSTEYRLFISISAGAHEFHIMTGYYSSDAYGYIDNKQLQFASSSSERYKHDIKDLQAEELDPHKLLSLPVRQFVYNEKATLQYPDTKNVTLPGFIAEEVDKHYPVAVIHGLNGEIESWDERRIIPGMLSLIQEQQKKIDDLEERLAKLERMVETLC